MTYAHLPAGYIVGKLLSGRFKHKIKSYPRYWFWGLLGSIAPDLDYLYLDLFDPQKYDHHYYPTHFPFFWAIVLAGSALWLYSSKKSQNPVFAFIFALNGCIHLMLDTLPNKIFWLAPLSYRGFSVNSLLIKIAPSIAYEHPYWSFSVEAIIIILAVYLFLKKRRNSTETAKHLSVKNSNPGLP
nr:metal-dependent hydrolase [Chlorobaculum thiosulfatiphilum]